VCSSADLFDYFTGNSCEMLDKCAIENSVVEKNTSAVRVEIYGRIYYGFQW
jgi:hypothetical protein